VRPLASASLLYILFSFLGDRLYNGPPYAIGPLSVLSVCNVGVCDQTVGWIRMPLGVEVGLDQGHVVLDGDPESPTERGTAAPHFSAHVYCGQTIAHLSNC